jgi:hypothetical protein
VADADSPDLIAFAGASADGSHVFIDTTVRMTADDNDSGGGDIFERTGGTTTLISKPTGPADPGSENVSAVGLSVDGRRIFMQTSQQLTADDLDANRLDVYVADDTAAAETTITDGAPAMTIDPTPSFAFSSSEPESTFECRVDGGAFVPARHRSRLGRWRSESTPSRCVRATTLGMWTPRRRVAASSSPMPRPPPSPTIGSRQPCSGPPREARAPRRGGRSARA